MPKITLDNWSGGWLTATGTALGPAVTNLLVAQNVEYFSTPDGQGGWKVKLRGRRGRAKFTPSAIISGGKVKDVWRYYARDGTAATVAVVLKADGLFKNFYHDTNDDGTFTTITGNFDAAPAKSWSFVTWPEKNKTFLANGKATEGGLYAYNGATLAAVTQSGVQMQGPYLTIYQNRLVGTRPDTIEREVYISDVDDELTVQGVTGLSLNDPQGGLITGLFGLKDRLAVLKTASLWYFLGVPPAQGSLVRYSDVGCVADRSAQLTPWGIVYVAQTGVMLTDVVSPIPQDLTGPLLAARFRTATTNTQFNNAVGVYYPLRNQYWLKLAPADTMVYVLTRLPFSDGSFLLVWAEYTAMPLAAGVSWSSETDDGRLLVADVTGLLYTVDSTSQDDGVDFTSTVQTPFFPEQAVTRVQRLDINYQGKAALSAGLRYNAAASNDTSLTVGAALGSPALQRTRVFNTDFAKWGTNWSLVLSHVGTNSQFELYDIGVTTRQHSGRYFR